MAGTWTRPYGDKSTIELLDPLPSLCRITASATVQFEDHSCQDQARLLASSFWETPFYPSWLVSRYDSLIWEGCYRSSTTSPNHSLGASPSCPSSVGTGGRTGAVSGSFECRRRSGFPGAEEFQRPGTGREFLC